MRFLLRLRFGIVCVVVFQGEYENVGSEWLVNGERSSSSTPSCTPSKEELLRLRRNAELRKIYDDLVSKYYFLMRLCWIYLTVFEFAYFCYTDLRVRIVARRALQLCY